MKLLTTIGLGRVEVPMRYVSKMRALVNGHAAKKACTGIGPQPATTSRTRIPNSWIGHRPVVAPEDFDVCPVRLTPARRGPRTPLHLSEPFLARITKVPVTQLMLPNGGHYPLEKEALDPMLAAISSFAADAAAAK